MFCLPAPPPVDTVKLNAAYGTVIGVLLFVIITLAIMVTLLVCCYRRESYQRSGTIIVIKTQVYTYTGDAYMCTYIYVRSNTMWLIRNNCQGEVIHFWQVYKGFN